MKETISGYNHSQPFHNYPQLKAAQMKTCFLIFFFSQIHQDQQNTYDAKLINGRKTKNGAFTLKNKR